jgi:hypothetical protein
VCASECGALAGQCKIASLIPTAKALARNIRLRPRGGQGPKGELRNQENLGNLYGRKVSSADGKYVRSGKERVIQARNGMVFIQAWIGLQLKRERRRDIRRWLESKKARVEKQIEKLDQHTKGEWRA